MTSGAATAPVMATPQPVVVTLCDHPTFKPYLQALVSEVKPGQLTPSDFLSAIIQVSYRLKDQFPVQVEKAEQKGQQVFLHMSQHQPGQPMVKTDYMTVLGQPSQYQTLRLQEA